MNSELKPCPFCGGEAGLVIDEPFKGFTFVECHECGSRGSISKERQAIKAWNTRAERTCYNTWLVELTGRLRFQCSECKAVSLEIAPLYCPVCGAKVVEE